MQEIRKIDILSLAKIYAIIGAIGGFIAGVIAALVTTVSGGYAGVPNVLSAFVGVAAIIVVPIVYAVFGFIGGVITAFIYNLAAGWVGGIEVELKEK